MKYFIKIGDEIHGPLSGGQVRLRMAEKGLTDFNLVRTEDAAAWVPLGTVPEFQGASGESPPLPNPMAALSMALALISIGLFVLLLTGKVENPSYLLAGIAAICLGHMAKNKIGYATAAVRGYGLAKTGLWLGYTVILFPIIGGFMYGGGCRISERGNQTKAISNCRQIITTLRLYASDNAGKYPDAALAQPRSSNEAFRLMFVGGQADNEQIFRSPNSPYHCDDNIGISPDYREAVQPGENHWAMTRGLTDSSDGAIPFVYENTFVPSWPPKWNADRTGEPKPGRTWSRGKIIIGLNDSSVSAQSLEATTGKYVGPKRRPDGSTVFPNITPKPEILEVEDR